MVSKKGIDIPTHISNYLNKIPSLSQQMEPKRAVKGLLGMTA